MTKSRRLLALLLAGGLCAAGGALAWRWHYQPSPAALLAAVPARPALGDLPAELAQRLTSSETSLRRGAGGIAALADLGQLYHANGFLPEAVTCYRGLAQLDPGTARWPHRLACIYAGFGQLDDALQLWQRTLQLDPAYVPARIRMGDVLLKLNRPAEAAAAYSAVLTREPANAYALTGLARLDLNAGRLTQARDRLEQAAAGSNSTVGADLLVTVAEQLGETDRAGALRAQAKSSGAFHDPPDPLLDEIFADCFDVYRLTVAAGFAEHEGNAPAAQRLIERALTLAPANAPALYQSTLLALHRGDLPRALRDAEACVRADPAFADGWAQLINVHTAAGNPAAAARALADGLAHCPTSPGLHLEHADHLAAAGQTQAAIAEFNTTLRLRPNDADALVKLANLHFRGDQIDDGVAALRRALAAEPDFPPALTTLAMYSIRTGDEAAAREWLRRVRFQVRVSRAVADSLAAEYRQRFGRAPR